MKARALLPLIVGLLVHVGLAAPTVADVSDRQVRRTIDRLIERLYQERNSDGLWGDLPPGDNNRARNDHHGGETALVVYALLMAGESYQDPRLQPAIEFLDRLKMRGTYAVSLRNHVWAHLPRQFRRNLIRDSRWLREAMGSGPTQGGYNYTPVNSGGGGRFDNSVTQYGVLGMWEGAKRGIQPGNVRWKRVENHFIQTQHESGGWSYQGGDREPTGSMTAAGLACLYITQDYLHRHDFRRVGQRPDHPLQARINRGMDWLVRNFSPSSNPGSGSWLYYYLYGVERVGLASGRKYFGDTNWFASAAEFLVRRPGGDARQMAFSLLFLTRGRAPVFANKLRIPGYHWHNRPSDLANLSRWASDQLERRMLWQIVPIDRPATDWMDAPLLYLAGHESLPLSEEQEAKIKRFIDLGGLLVTTADDNRQAFSSSIRDMLQRLYPEYSMQPLGPDDELMDTAYQLDANKLRVQSLHNGVRHLALHIPRDVSWDLHSESHEDPFPWKLLTNAYHYATEKTGGRARLSTHVLRREADAGARLPLTVGRADYEGNSNPEPLAWRMQSIFMLNEGKLDVSTKTVQLDDLPDPAEVPFVHVVGTQDVQFTQAHVRSIKRYTQAGGFLLFENAGGRGDFARAARDVLDRAYPFKELKPLPLESPVIRGQLIGGYNLSEVDYRRYTLLRLGRINSPRLLGLEVNGRQRVFVTGEDLSQAVLGQPVWGVFGYSTDSARKLMANLALYSLWPDDLLEEKLNPETAAPKLEKTDGGADTDGDSSGGQ